MQPNGRARSDPFSPTHALGHVPVNNKPFPTGSLTIQTQPAKSRAVRGGSDKPTSLATQAIKVLTAASFRAKLEFRQATRAADRALSDVIKAVRSGDESEVLRASSKFEETLRPLASAYSVRTTDHDVQGACLSRKIPTDDKLLASLNDALAALPDDALNDPVIGHLDFIVEATILNKRARAIEGNDLVFDVDARTTLDLPESSLKRLQELMDLGKGAGRLHEGAPRHQALREKIPGTQLSLSRLGSMVAYGKAAAKEMATREAQFTALASPKSDALQKMSRSALMALSEKVVDGLEFPAWSKNRSQLLTLHWNVSEQIRLREEAIMKPIVGSIDTYDATKQEDKDLTAQRKAAIGVSDTPLPLVNAANRMRIEIAHRKDLSRHAFQRALADAVNQSGTSKAPATLARLVMETQKAMTKFERLNDKLTQATLATWIDDTRQNHPTPFAAREKLLRDALGALGTPKDAATAQALDLLRGGFQPTPKPLASTRAA